VALFLFGMLRLSEEVQRYFSGTRVRGYFKFAVERPIFGLLTGVAATILFQSSTATSVLVVGMVSAGLMSFYRSLGIILGADIGTTLTVQLVVWKITDISPVFVVVGGALWFAGKDRWKSIGEGIFFFGLIFFGLSIVSAAAAPLKDHPAIVEFFRQAHNPFVGLLAGLLFASIIHSSAIPISILVILAQQGLMTLENALPIVFGANVGTAVTALMAGLVANVNGKRSALSHFLFKFFGTVICLAGLPLLIGAVAIVSSDPAQQIALGHLLFNVVIVAVFIFLLRPFSYLVERIIPGKATQLPLWPEFLDENSLGVPEKALECVRKEMHRDLVIVANMFERGIRLLKDYREGARKDIVYIEFVVDNLRREVSDYLCKMSENNLSPGLARWFFDYSGMADDIERSANHVMVIANLARQKHHHHAEFTRFAFADLDEICELVSANLEDVISMMIDHDPQKVSTILEREDRVDLMVKEARNRHLERFHKGVCQAEAGPIFVEILIHVERICDHCVNIAEYLQDMHG
jgi:phosphate:Na+ symporter